MNKFNKVSFEEMLKYQGLIACEHELLIEDLYKTPMKFSHFLTKLGTCYTDIEIKEIFLNCTWYNVIREKGIVINLNDYINTYIDNEYDDNYEYITKEKVENIFDKIDSEIYDNLLYAIYKSTFGNNDPGIMKTCKISDKQLDGGKIDKYIAEELKNIYDKIDEDVKELINKKSIKSFSDIGNIVELELPKCDVGKDILEEQIRRYIKFNNGNIYIIHNGGNIDKLGDIVSYNDNKIKVKLIDEMKPVFESSNKKVELVIPEYLTNTGTTVCLRAIFINADNNDSQHEEDLNNIVELELPECGLDSVTLGKQIEKYIESHNGDIYIIHKNESKKLGNILSYNDNKIKVKLINDMVPLFESSNKKVELIMPVDLINGGIDLKYVFINADKPLSLPYKEELSNFLDSLKQMYFKE